MTRPNLKQARALLDGVTAGPWENRIAVKFLDHIAAAERSGDARFIAASRTLVPALLDEIERLRRLAREACDLAARRECIDDADACRCERLDAIRAEIGDDE